MKGSKQRLISQTESAIFIAGFVVLTIALVVSLFLAQQYLVGTARTWDFLRIERYMRLCQLALESQPGGEPSKETLRKLRDIGLGVGVYPPDRKIPEPNPRYDQATESVEMWGQLRDSEGRPTAVIHLSRHDINTRHTLRAVRLYTLAGAVGGIALIAVIGLVLHNTIIRRVTRISGDIKARLPDPGQVAAQEPLDELGAAASALIDATEQAVARSQRLLDAHTEMLCVSTKDGTILEINEAYCRFFGKSREQLVGTNYLDLVPAPDRADALRSVHNLSRASPVSFSRHRVLLSDGSLRWVRWRDSAVVGPDGTIKEVLSYGTDISPEKNLAGEIERLEFAFAQMQSLAETGSVTWDFGRNAMEWTTETRRLLDVRESTKASLDALLDIVSPEDREQVRRLFRAAREDGRAFECEFRVTLPDRSQRVLQSRAEVLADPKTKLLNHLTCTLRDITALRDAEATTKRELRFREAIEQSLAVGLVVRDMKGRTLSANPAFAKMVGFSERELIAAVPPEEPYWPADQRKTIEAALAEALAGSAPKEGFQLVFNRKDQTRFDALVSVAPVRDEQGVPCAMLGAVTDISALQEARRKLQETNERMRIAQDVVGLGVWIWDPVTDILLWDRNSFAMFGHPEATDPKEVWAAVHSEEARERLTYELRRLIASGGANGQDRLRIGWPDGSEHEILSTYVIIRDGSGKAKRVIGVNRDVTAELEEEQELRNATKRLTAALEGGNFGTFEHVFGVGAINWNPVNYEIHGIDPAITDPDELFKAWKALVGDGYPAIEQTIASLPVDQASVAYDFDICLPGAGEKRRIRSSIFVDRNKNGHPVRLVGISRRLE